MFNRAATNARTSRKAEEIITVGDLSVYPGELRRGAEFQPLTGTTRAWIENNPQAAGTATARVLLVEGPGYYWRESIGAGINWRKSEKIVEEINTQAAQLRVTPDGGRQQTRGEWLVLVEAPGQPVLPVGPFPSERDARMWEDRELDAPAGSLAHFVRMCAPADAAAVLTDGGAR